MKQPMRGREAWSAALRDIWRRHPTAVIGGRAAAADPLDGDLRAAADKHRSERAAARYAACAGRTPNTGSAPTRSAATSTAACSTARACRCSSASSVAVLSTLVGLVIGLLSGFYRSRRRHRHARHGRDDVDPADPAGDRADGADTASIQNVILAITIAEIPRVSRLVRGVVLTLREQPFVEAARAIGTRNWRIMARHILPNTVAPLIVQATYICASAIITEAILSFLGAGTPPTIPSWGNIIAEGRTFFLVSAYIILIPGVFLSITVLASQSCRRRAARRARPAAGAQDVMCHG